MLFATAISFNIRRTQVEKDKYMVNVHVQHCDEGEWVALESIGLDSRPHLRLGQHELRQFVQVEFFFITLE